MVQFSASHSLSIFCNYDKDPFECDGSVYLCKCLNEFDISVESSPFEVSETRKWSCHHINERLASQSGLFTISNNPLEEINTGMLHRIKIVRDSKKRILKTLETFGVHHGTIFPGLDGVAKYVTETNRIFYRINSEQDFIDLIGVHEEILDTYVK